MLRIEVPEAGLAVSARLDGPVGEGPLLVFGHGAGAGMDHPVLDAFAVAFAARGLATLRYQFPFLERKGGRGFGRDPLPVAVGTVAAAVAEAQRHAGGRPILAGGHSYGGRMTTHAAAEGRLGGVRALVLLAFPLHGPKRPSTARAAHLGRIGTPMLFVSGERDAMAGAPLLEQVVDALPQARLVRIAAADHGWKAPKRRWPEGPFDAVGAAVADFLAEQGLAG
ncbi:MAG: alpha/beta family hydrolase [Pseudomonadales bacterium]|nr:alpha/beta family hydrolase [Pseudomonadales bacterium]